MQIRWGYEHYEFPQCRKCANFCICSLTSAGAVKFRPQRGRFIIKFIFAEHFQNPCMTFWIPYSSRLQLSYVISFILPFFPTVLLSFFYIFLYIFLQYFYTFQKSGMDSKSEPFLPYANLCKLGGSTVIISFYYAKPS